jgi:hypothetical protein
VSWQDFVPSIDARKTEVVTRAFSSNQTATLLSSTSATRARIPTRLTTSSHQVRHKTTSIARLLHRLRRLCSKDTTGRSLRT